MSNRWKCKILNQTEFGTCHTILWKKSISPEKSAELEMPLHNSAAISNLLTGPDLLNNLLVVLMRFREHTVTVLPDIEGMFMQIAIHQIDQSALRLLWLSDNQIQQYQITRLIFGAGLCAQYTFLTIVSKRTVNNS